LEGIPHDLDKRYHGEQRTLEQQQQHPIMRSKYESDMERARNILQHNLRKERTGNEKLEKLPKATQTNLPPPLSAICQSPVPKPISVRQDSNVSSDSFSQTSSPSYTSKTMEAPLLPHKHGKVPGMFKLRQSLPHGCIIVSEELIEALEKKSLNTIFTLHTKKDLNILDMIKLRRFLRLYIIKIIKTIFTNEK